MIGLGKISWGYEEDPLVLRRMKYPTHFSVLRAHPHFQLVAAQDKSVDARSAFARYAKKFHSSPAIYENWEEMIKSEKPELLIVASDTASHVEICNRAIDLGIKTILCEKPLSYTLPGAEALVRKAKKNHCALFVNYLRAFNPSYIRFIGDIQHGLLGRIQSFDAKYSRGILNNGTHLIDLLLRMFGPVNSVHGFKNPTRIANESDPTTSGALTFKNGTSGYLHGLNNDCYNIFELDILGEQGRITIVYDNATLFLRKPSGVARGYYALRLSPKKGLIDMRSGLYPVYDNISRCMNLGNAAQNFCSGADALRALRVANDIIASLK